jgi:hypothetical protein
MRRRDNIELATITVCEDDISEGGFTIFIWDDERHVIDSGQILSSMVAASFENQLHLWV